MHGNCILCGHQYFFEIPGTKNFKFVTSDCEFTEFNSVINVCRRCGHIQKDITKQWLENVKVIYSRYSPYSLSEGRDQLVFDSFGVQHCRSYHILKQFFTEHSLPYNGALLDVGCGNGELLAAFNSIYPEWDLAGFEIEGHQRERIIDKKTGTLFYQGDINSIEGEFDLITLFNVFEHVIDPDYLLTSLRSKLKDNGMLLVYVPNIMTSLFDLLVFDHCSHFEQKTMDFVLKKNGFQGIFHAYHPYDRYLFVAAKKLNNAARGSFFKIDAGINAEFVKEHVISLRGILEQVRSYDAGEGIGVFGTTIAGTWIAGMLKESVIFFVDEDVKKTGKTHQYKLILHPKDVPGQSIVFLAFPSQESGAMKQRLEKEYQKIKFIGPSYQGT